MKRLQVIVGFIVLCLFLLGFSSDTYAQRGIPKSLKATTFQRLGMEADLTINYSRPGVKERKIWGDLVPYGLAPGNNYSDNKPYPWRAGANENTTFESNVDLVIEGNKLPAGKYGVHMIPSENEWTLMFSKNNSAWGSFKYNKDEDALRFKVTPVEAAHQEWLYFGFEDLAGKSATAFLHWEKLKVPFKVEIAE